jgi:hypothetical protein
MNRYAVVSATKAFIRTRQGVNAAPTVRGLIRHIEATTRLYESFVPNGSGRWLRRLAFRIYRGWLAFACDLRSAVEQFSNWF